MMNAKNLAVCLAPNILIPEYVLLTTHVFTCSREETIEIILSNALSCNELVALLIEKAPFFFTEGLLFRLFRLLLLMKNNIRRRFNCEK